MKFLCLLSRSSDHPLYGGLFGRWNDLSYMGKERESAYGTIDFWTLSYLEDPFPRME